MATGTDRYQAKRDAGISPIRKDGSLTSAENDEQAAAAEKFAAQYFGCTFNDQVYQTGDGGYDFLFELKIEVIWLGVNAVTGEERREGNLIVNPNEPQRWSDIYVVVAGSTKAGFEVLGWTTHYRLIEEPPKDFGYGKKLAMNVNKLWPPHQLRKLKR